MNNKNSPFNFTEARISTWGNDLPDLHLYLKCSKLGASEVNQIKQRVERYGICIVRKEGAGFTTNIASDEELENATRAPLDPNLEMLQQAFGDISDEQSGTGSPTAKLIVSDPDADPLSGNTMGVLLPHVDGSHLSAQPPLILLQYLVTPDVGGALYFVDMARILEKLFLESNERYFSGIHALSKDDAIKIQKHVGDKIKIYEGPFFCQPSSSILRAAQCRARFDSKVSPSHDAKNAFEDLKNKVENLKNRIYYIPQAGDIVILDNWRVLHGRSQVKTTHHRKHRRLWINNLFPAANIYVGVRPVDIGRPMSSDGAGTESAATDAYNLVAEYLSVSYDLLQDYGDAMKNDRAWPGEANWDQVLHEDQLYQRIRMALNSEIALDNEILQSLEQLRSSDNCDQAYFDIRDKIVSKMQRRSAP